MINVIECDRLIRMKPDDLLRLPICIRVNKFDESSAREFDQSMSDAHQTGQPVIPVLIDSYGGEVYSLLSMISSVQNARLPVATIVSSKAMSAGLFLFSCGARGHRYCSPDATFMLHEVIGGTYGKVEDIKVATGEVERINAMLFRLLAKNCRRPDGYFVDLLHKKSHVDYYMSAREAKRHGLVSHLRIPEYRTSVKVEFSFG